MRPSSIIFDTHALLWFLKNKIPQISLLLKNYKSWIISPVSLLEIQILVEVGKINLDFDKMLEALKHDSRFILDQPNFYEISLASLKLSWTRDPFDRLLVAHSIYSSSTLLTHDSVIRTNYSNTIDPKQTFSQINTIF